MSHHLLFDFTLQIRRCFLLFLLFFSCYILHSQEIPQIISYERSDYNAAHQNWMISQDCDGLIYVANSDGLLIYNGMDWQRITMPNRQRPRAVFLGNDCKIYTGGFEFFGYIDNSDRSQPAFVSLSDDILNSSNQEIWNIVGIENKIIFQSFSNIYSFSETQGVSSIATPSNIMLGVNINAQIYIPRIEQGIYTINGDSVSLIEQSLQLPAKSKIASMAKGKNKQQLLIGTQYNGLFLLSEKELVALKSPLNSQLKKEQINKILLLENGDYAIGTIVNGLYITDSAMNIKYHLNKENGLTNNTILSLFQDSTGDLWVGMDKGINLLKLNNPNRFYYDRKGELGSIFTSINYKDQIYLGTNQGLFRQASNGEYELVENSQGQTWSLLEVDGDLLIGHNNGTFQLIEGRFEKICEETGGWAMTEVRSGLVLQSTYNGLITMEKKSSRWQLRAKLNNGGLQISKFRLDKNVLLGYYSNYGVCILTLDSDFLEVVEDNRFAEVDGLSLQDDLIFTLSSDPTGLIVENELYTLQNNKLAKVPDNKRQEFDKSTKYNALVSTISQQYRATNTNFINSTAYPEELLVGTDDGYIIAKTGEAKVKESKLEIDYILINGRIVEDYNPSFASDENDLIVQLSTEKYDQTQGVVEYQLKGWDTSYYNIPQNGKLEFFNLDDGNYELVLRDQGLSENNLLTFHVSPHWYESWVGFMLYFMLGMVILYLVNKQAQRQHKKEQERLIRIQQKELEAAQMKSKNENLEKEILYKSKMLANSTLALVQKNKMLGDLRTVIQRETAKTDSSSFPKNKIYKLIDRNINSDQDWEIFERNFAAVHRNFLDKLKETCPEISTGELKLAAYIKMNLASKEIAPLLNISVRSIENKRYRLRKKLGVDKEKSLKEYLMML